MCDRDLHTICMQVEVVNVQVIMNTIGDNGTVQYHCHLLVFLSIAVVNTNTCIHT